MVSKQYFEVGTIWHTACQKSKNLLSIYLWCVESWEAESVMSSIRDFHPALDTIHRGRCCWEQIEIRVVESKSQEITGQRRATETSIRERRDVAVNPVRISMSQSVNFTKSCSYSVQVCNTPSRLVCRRKFESEFNAELQSLVPTLSKSSQAEPYLTHLAQCILGVGIDQWASSGASMFGWLQSLHVWLCACAILRRGSALAAVDAGVRSCGWTEHLCYIQHYASTRWM